MNVSKEKVRRMSVKVVGVNGQISIGKQYAGRRVQIEEHGIGVWLVRTVMVIPDSERPPMLTNSKSAVDGKP
jgi:hypothetical protein